MEYRDFLYWLNGYFELNETPKLTKKQLETIKDHLLLVSATKDRIPQEDLTYLSQIYKFVVAWINDLGNKNELPSTKVHVLSELIESRMKKISHKRQEYEPLGDVYNNQRLC